MAKWETKKALIVVRTYPTPARSGVEVSCTAAVTEQATWLRLFPVPWRFLAKDKQFRRYQWVSVLVCKAKADNRPESYHLDPEGIKVLGKRLGTGNAWQARKSVVFPLRVHCLCCLKKERDASGFPTLGIFRPASIKRLVIATDTSEWSDAQLSILRQGQLFGSAPKRELEKIPFTFQYEFNCAHDTCAGHKLACTDWEMGQSYRKWRRTYKATWEQKFRRKYEREMIEERDTHFYVGTVHRFPDTWIICGLFYPPHKEGALPLFAGFE